MTPLQLTCSIALGLIIAQVFVAILNWAWTYTERVLERRAIAKTVVLALKAYNESKQNKEEAELIGEKTDDEPNLH